MMEKILAYFPDLSVEQIEKFSSLKKRYEDWNEKINVISRKDMDDFYERHVLHSLGIAKIQPFEQGSKILDIGTGGGFPGIPLAIMFPEVHFHLVDSIGKKIKVVQEVAQSMGLKNVLAEQNRAENITGEYDFIVSRAVTGMDDFVKWTKNKIAKKQIHTLKNGILYLKGGDLADELRNFEKATVFQLSDYFGEAFFETKKLVHIPLKYRG